MKLVHDDADAVADAFADRFLAAAPRSVAERGRFAVALTGGSSAKVYARLVRLPVDWARVHVFFTDERAVPPDADDSNYGLVKRILLDKVRIPEANVHRVRGEANLFVAADDYERELERVLGPRKALDLVHLGVGDDGHVCSLFPGDAALGEERFVTAVEDSPKPPPRRITLTLAALASARTIWLTVTGAEKAAVVREALGDGPSDLPVSLATREHRDVVWMLDRAAAR